MVEAVVKEVGELTFEVHHPNNVTPLLVYQDNPQYAFFSIRYPNNSPTPNKLKGRYTSAQDAIDACCRYLETKKESTEARRKYLAEQAEKRKKKKEAAKSATKLRSSD